MIDAYLIFQLVTAPSEFISKVPNPCGDTSELGQMCQTRLSTAYPSLNLRSAYHDAPTLFEQALPTEPLREHTTVDSTTLAASSDFTRINWRTAQPSPLGSSEASGAPANGKLYVFGGFIDSTFNPTRLSYIYNPVSNAWARIKDLPKPSRENLSGGLTHAGTASDLTNSIYLAGGYAGKLRGGQIFATENVWRYNVTQNTWTAMPPLPEARGSGELSLLGRELHFFGGVDVKRVDQGDHWVLNLDDGQGAKWTPAAPLPNPRSHMGDAVLGGKIYAIGGQHGTDRNLVTQNSVHVWAGAPGTQGSWKKVVGLPRARSHISSSTFVMDGRIIVIGGEVAHGSSVADVTAYNPASNSWRSLTPLPQARYSGIARSIGNQIFYTTGGPGFKSTTYRGVPVP